MLKWGSFQLGMVILVAGLIVGTFSHLIPALFPGPPPSAGAIEMTLNERFVYVGMMFGPLPPWVKQWMAFQHYVFAGSLLFVLWHKEAQIYLLGITASHAFSYIEIAVLPTAFLGLDLVALNHWLWIPAWIAILRYLRDMRFQSGYDLWLWIAFFQLSFSLVFDLQDGIDFFSRVITG